MATVVLAGRSSTLADLEPLMARVGEVLAAIRPGEVIRVAA